MSFEGERLRPFSGKPLFADLRKIHIVAVGGFLDAGLVESIPFRVVKGIALRLRPLSLRRLAFWLIPASGITLYESGSVEMNDESSLKALLAKQPLGLGEPEQVAWPACFLLSDAASFITGVNLPVDGGYLAQ